MYDTNVQLPEKLFLGPQAMQNVEDDRQLYVF